MSAAEMFTLANAERRAGDAERAMELYKTLIKHHPEAAESQAARVSLGRLLLDKRGDAAGALAQFDAYLANAAGDGALSEEARVGRATALQRLGRAADEKRAWEELLQHHPQSVHAGRARERLDAIP
jgi:TolA-binding protein